MALATVDARTSAPWRWISSPSADVVSAFGWLPVFALVHALHGRDVRTAAGVILLFSLVHQAVTPFLLASDAPTRRKHPVVYAAGIPVVLVGSWLLRRAGLEYVAVVAAGWNLVHTLRQRYGIVRLYGRSAGQDRRRIEQGIIFGPFVMTAALVLWLPGRLERVDALGFGGINDHIVSGLDRASPLAPWALVAAAAFTAFAARRVLAGSRPPSPAKRLYLVAYWLSLAAAVVDPVAGLLALVAAHSFEYFFVLDATLGRRFGAPGTGLHRALHAVGRRRLLALIALSCTAAILLVRRTLPGEAYALVYMTIGGSHFLFDGFMWGGGRRTTAA